MRGPRQDWFTRTIGAPSMASSAFSSVQSANQDDSVSARLGGPDFQLWT